MRHVKFVLGIMCVMLVAGFTVSSATGETLTSARFSIGFGFDGPSPGQWTTEEIAPGLNTPTTMGDFSFVPTLTSQGFSSEGPTFVNRQPVNGFDWCAINWDSPGADSRDTPPQIVGTYNGTLPPGATNVQLTLDVDNIRVYASGSYAGPLDVWWSETTPGHESDSGVTMTGEAGGHGFAWTYLQNQFTTAAPLTVPGVTATRTFTVKTSDEGTLALEGFEVYGTVILNYDIAPTLEGDANRDGVVSAGDYASVQSHFGDTGAAGILGDANIDGVVSAGDYASVQANFGNVAPPLAPIPEPATLSMLVMGGVALIRRKRK
jgi:hypothetical protein